MREPARYGHLIIDMLMVPGPGSGLSWTDLWLPDTATLDPDVSWQMVAERYLDFHKRGWITDQAHISDFEFAVARAEVLQRRANAELSPVETPR